MNGLDLGSASGAVFLDFYIVNIEIIWRFSY